MVVESSDGVRTSPSPYGHGEILMNEFLFQMADVDCKSGHVLSKGDGGDGRF